jgi:Fe-S cluster assembly protein SufD
MVASAQAGFLESLRVAKVAPLPNVAWFDRLRSSALERANALSVPSTRDEEWRFTDLAPLTRLSFQPAIALPALSVEDLRPWLLPEAGARLVFVDGIWAPHLSVLPADSPGVRVLDLRSALPVQDAVLERHLGQFAAFDAQLFTALNTAFLRDAAIVCLDPERTLAEPVHILHVATMRDTAHASYPRTLLVAGSGSRCVLIEDFVALGAGTYFSAPVTEIALGANASVEHIRLQREGSEAFHVATCAVVQDTGSRYEAVSLALGGRISRLDLNIAQRAPGCDTVLNALTMIERRQLADMHSFVDHAQPEGRLRQMQKCVVGGGAHAVFNGKVIVRAGAVHTDAAQSFRALLLSDRAHVDTKPQLEIFADDVKCAHGAAIGQLDPEQMFYLCSRGLSADGARNLLTYAFAAEVIERVSVRSLAATLARTVMERTQENT